MNPKIRRSIQDLQDDYTTGKDKKPLEDLMRAWKGIKELPPTDPHSFFTLGGYHGEPFRGAGWGSAVYWGGYCNHGNVLFPTWHRVYLLALEESLRSIKGCEDVALPFWDETSDGSLSGGIPTALTWNTFELDGATIPNPLRSFVFTASIQDNINGDDPNYGKPKGYETVRYPLSGLVGSPTDLAATKAHNARYPDYDTNVNLLNANVIKWLTSITYVDDKQVSLGIKHLYQSCLNAPNYTVFSNGTSAAEWNTNLSPGSQIVVPLESPHDSMHLAVGGYDAPTFDASPIYGANGDMGENDTAGLDPIFFFHHCFVDRVFWLWQKRHGATKHLDITPQYPGTNTVDSQGPTPGMVPNSWLTLDTPLNPFKKPDGSTYTSGDCTDIEEQMGYTYGPGSLEEEPLLAGVQPPGAATKIVRVSGLNRARIRGSFLICAFEYINGKRQHIGTRAVLSRWSVQGCANCQTHLETKAFFHLHGVQGELAHRNAFEVEVRTRDGLLGNSSALSSTGKKPFHVEVR